MLYVILGYRDDPNIAVRLGLCRIVRRLWYRAHLAFGENQIIFQFYSVRLKFWFINLLFSMTFQEFVASWFSPFWNC